MTWWDVYALLALGVPLAVVAGLVVAGVHGKRRRARSRRNWSVTAIRKRVEREWAEDDLARARTEALPVIEPEKPIDGSLRQPTQHPPVAVPGRVRRYAQSPRSDLRLLSERRALQRTERALEGLQNAPGNAIPPHDERQQR